MKFGVIIHKSTMNIGDDIQTYAAAKLLPQVDYAIDRDYIDTFETEKGEPVAVVMNAWWMWKKWNWPPAECIIPKLTSMHINNYGIERKSSPIYDEWLEGCGREYVTKYGPVGCRDQATLEFLQKQKIDAYFSGCLTLTLPQQKKTSDAGTYVCIVDLNKKLEKKARELLKDTGLEIRVMSHKCDYRNSKASLEERFEKVEEVLTQYQNAKFVITRRLHVTLPCVALGTPVLSIVDLQDVGNTTRWGVYKDMLHCVDNKEFLAENFNFDFRNPPCNKPEMQEIRKKLIAEVGQFVNEYRDCSLSVDEVRKTTYSAEEKILWQNEMMKKTLDKWLKESRKMLAEKKAIEEKWHGSVRKLKKYKKYVAQLQKEGIVVDVDLPEVEEVAETKWQMQKQMLFDKIIRKVETMTKH